MVPVMLARPALGRSSLRRAAVHGVEQCTVWSMVRSSARCGAVHGVEHGVEQCTVCSSAQCGALVLSAGACAYQRAGVGVQTQGQKHKGRWNGCLMTHCCCSQPRQQEDAHVGCIGDAGGRSRAHT